MGSEENNNELYKITTSQQVIASCCGAIVTSLLVTPLDVVKIRLQAQSNSFANVGSLTVVSPLELIRTKMQSRQLSYKQLHICINNTLAKDGWLSLWRGWGPTALRDVPFSAMYWYHYERIKKRLHKTFDVHEPTFMISFTSGAAAGSIAATITLPFDVVKTHKQTEIWEYETLNLSQKKSTSTWTVMKTIVAEHGFTGLFAGIVPRLIKVAPACAIMISTYEYGKSFFRKLNKQKIYNAINSHSS